MADYLWLLIYVGGFVAMALVIRATTARERLDRDAAFVACMFWPGALTLFVGGLVAIGFYEIFWPDTKGNEK
jgi:TRAP-type C4-dicarboxylate transport system permease small subunit